MAQWYIMFNNQQVGPMSVEQLKAYNLNANTQVWTEGMAQWAPVYSIPELMAYLNSPAGGAGQQPQMQQGGGPGVPPPSNMGGMGGGNSMTNSGKDHVVAGILALLLGGLGIQYFYMGKPAGGAICLAILLVGILTSLLVIGAILLTIWGILMFVQGIMMLTMSQQQFDQKYVYSQSSMPLF
ncbi:MAG: DUF4339 domain-containing protein [Muribaculaceae bacterium]|nr:DUF4339 domain-containing protein [Muribaculaceae bacterium]